MTVLIILCLSSLSLFHLGQSFSLTLVPSSLQSPAATRLVPFFSNKTTNTLFVPCKKNTVHKAHANPHIGKQQDKHNPSENYSSTSSSSSRNQEQPTLFVLPIFPLSKRVKFPTERLKLTLWEERYKALARYVLDHPSCLSLLIDNHDGSNDSNNDSNNNNKNVPIFGALYASHKAQIVKGGKSPITPVIEPNDVGVLCCVTSSQVFRKGRRQGGGGEEAVEVEMEVDFQDEEDVEKIRLWGLGLARFRVVKVLSTGYNCNNGGNNDCNQCDDDGDDDEIHCSNEDGDSLPFILVQAVLEDDKDMGDDDILLLHERLKQLLHRLDVKSRNEILLGLEECNKFMMFQRGNDDNQMRKQQIMLTTFALTSQLEASAPAMEMLEMLRTCSTVERVDYLELKLPRETSTLWIKDKFRMLFQ